MLNNKTMVQYPQDLVPTRDIVDGSVLANDAGTLVYVVLNRRFVFSGRRRHVEQ